MILYIFYEHICIHKCLENVLEGCASNRWQLVTSAEIGEGSKIDGSGQKGLQTALRSRPATSVITLGAMPVATCGHAGPRSPRASYQQTGKPLWGPEIVVSFVQTTLCDIHIRTGVTGTPSSRVGTLRGSAAYMLWHFTSVLGRGHR